MSLYNLKRLAPDTYMVAKFSEDFEVESTYTLTTSPKGTTCDCPANNRSVITKLCRHRQMFRFLLPHVDTDNFYDPDTGKFSTPLGDLFRPEAGDLAGRDAMIDALDQVVGEALHDQAPSYVIPETSPNLEGIKIEAERIGAKVVVQPASIPASGSAIIIRRR